jgi:hypothetical protein
MICRRCNRPHGNSDPLCPRCKQEVLESAPGDKPGSASRTSAGRLILLALGVVVAAGVVLVPPRDMEAYAASLQKTLTQTCVRLGLLSPPQQKRSIPPARKRFTPAPGAERVTRLGDKPFVMSSRERARTRCPYSR